MNKITPLLWFDGQAEESTAAMMTMVKIDVAALELEKAYRGE